MRTKRTVIFLGLGVLFLLYTILARYLLWAYSYNFGIYFTLLGAVLRSSMSAFHIWLVATVGLVYIAFAYIPMPEPASILFGLAGGVMTFVMVYVIWRWASVRDKLIPLG